MRFPTEELKNWFLENKRLFPWRENPTPYGVWVSEIMLQQTQAAVVVPYFERWMETFPTLIDLANAEKAEVIKMWEGLGYYSRAVNLYEGARYCVEHYESKIPENQEDLSKIKGIGPYTLGAILSFAFHKKIAAIDGNILRVIARYFAISDSIDMQSTKQEISKRVFDFLPEEGSHIINEALIELGATLCQKKPQCTFCPLQSGCVAYARGLTTQLPKKNLKQPPTLLFRAVAIIQREKSVLLTKGVKGRVMAELYEFPYIEMEKFSSLEEIKSAFEERLQLKLDFIKSLPIEKHTFTRYRATLFPLIFDCKKMSEGHFWHSDPLKLPFSSGHRRILHEWLK